jgi:hypothetical protein
LRPASFLIDELLALAIAGDLVNLPDRERSEAEHAGCIAIGQETGASLR